MPDPRPQKAEKSRRPAERPEKSNRPERRVMK